MANDRKWRVCAAREATDAPGNGYTYETRVEAVAVVNKILAIYPNAPIILQTLRTYPGQNFSATVVYTKNYNTLDSLQLKKLSDKISK